MERITEASGASLAYSLRRPSRRWLIGVLPLVLLVTQACAQGPSPIPKDRWLEFTSADRRYKLLMPGKPRWQKPGKGIPTDMRMFLVDLKSGSFMVATTDIPPRLMPGMTVDRRLKSAGQGFAGRIPGGKLVSETKVEIDTYPGREFVVKAADMGQYVVRVYLVENRLYLLAAGGKDFTADHADVVKFFSSFKLKRAVNAAATSFDGLLGYWSFDEEDAKLARDSAGGGHHLALQGARRVDGKRGKALEFDGKSHLKLGPARRFDLAPRQGLTVTGWFQTSNTRTGTLLSMRNPRRVNVRGEAFGLIIGFNDRKLFVTLPDAHGGKLRDIKEGDLATSKLKLDDGRWHHFAVTLDGFQTAHVYIDGTLAAGPSLPGVLQPVATTERIIGMGYKGRLDEFALFNRELKPAEIKALAGQDYGFEDKPRPPLELPAEMETADPVELSFECSVPLYNLSFDPGGKHLVGGGAAWDVWTGKRNLSHPGIGLAELVRDGKLLVRLGQSSGPAFLAYDLDTRERKDVVETSAEALCVSSDAKYVFAAGKTFRKVDLDTGRVLESWPMPRKLGWMIRSRWATYCARADGVAIQHEKGLMLLSAKDGALLWDFPSTSIADVALAPDGNLLACLEYSVKGPYKVHWLEVKSGKITHTLEGAVSLMYALAYTPNGKYLVVASRDGFVDFWSVAERKLKRTIKHSTPGDPPGFLAFSPDGQRLGVYMSGTFGGPISLINVGLALGLSDEEVKALDVRKKPLPERKLDKDILKPRPRQTFGDAAATRLQFKGGKINGYYRVTDVDPPDRGGKGTSVKLFLLPLEAGQTYRFEIAPNLGEQWEHRQYRMRIEDAKGMTLASNLRKPGDSVGPIRGRLTFTAPKAGTYRLVVPLNGWVLRGFTLSVSPTKDAGPPR
jgi:hypothetical protein